MIVRDEFVIQGLFLKWTIFKSMSMNQKDFHKQQKPWLHRFDEATLTYEVTEIALIAHQLSSKMSLAYYGFIS